MARGPLVRVSRSHQLLLVTPDLSRARDRTPRCDCLLDLGNHPARVGIRESIEPRSLENGGKIWQRAVSVEAQLVLVLIGDRVEVESRRQAPACPVPQKAVVSE